MKIQLAVHLILYIIYAVQNVFHHRNEIEMVLVKNITDPAAKNDDGEK